MIPIAPGQVHASYTVLGKQVRDMPVTGWFLRCKCGTIKWLAQNAVKNAGSCGCVRRERNANLTNVQRDHRGAYRSWTMMKNRCNNPNATQWEHYGGRGITVCDRWNRSFKDFLADLGERPEGKTLDRIDVNGNYEPGNCRWATAKEQANNRRKPALVGC